VSKDWRDCEITSHLWKIPKHYRSDRSNVLVIGVAGNKTLECVHIIQSHYRHKQAPHLTERLVLWVRFYSPLDTKLKWPSVPNFLGQSRFLITCPGKNSSPRTPICPVFGLVSQICPDFPIPAAVCICIGGQKLARFYLYIKKSLAVGAPTQTPLGELTMTPRSQVGLQWLARACGLHPTICTFGTCPKLWYPKYGHLTQNMSFRRCSSQPIPWLSTEH